jgi:circadian clock protein KaiC
VTRSKSAPPPIPRLPTGIEQLDIVLEGGLLKGSSYIAAGAPGAGKTILGNQICFNHIAAGGRAVYLTLLTESHGRMLAHLGTMSFFDPDAVAKTMHYVSGYDLLRKEHLKGLLTLVRKEIKRHRATLLVIDGLVRVGAFAGTVVEFKQFIHEMNVLLAFTGCTALLLTDSTAGDFGYPARTMVDGLIELSDMMDGVRAVRELTVSKFRGSGYLRGAHFFEIDEGGIHLYARLEARLAQPSRVPAPISSRLEFGIAGLDRMMGGGTPEGTTTMVLGSSGTGRTILGLHFLAAGFEKREPGLYFGFYESPPRLLQKGDQLGLQLTKNAGKGLFEIVWQPAGELIMDALAERLLETVVRRKIKRVVIDGLVGFEESTVRTERLSQFFKALTNELRGLGVTTVVTEELRELLAMDIKAPLSASAGVVENIIVLRRLEIAFELKRAIAVLKTRETAHDDKVRELSITDRGLEVREPFAAQDSVLTGGSAPPPGRKQRP